MTKDQFLQYQPANEDQFTAATNRFVNMNYPELRNLYFHVPNESATSDKMRMKLRSMGVLPGVPDFIFLAPKTWAMELKHRTGRLSPRQEQIGHLWAEKGILVFVCWTPAAVIDVLASQVRPIQ